MIRRIMPVVSMTGKMSPSAVLVIQNGATKLVNIKNQDTVTKILDMVPDVIDKFTGRSGDVKMDDDMMKPSEMFQRKIDCMLQ